MVPRYWRVVLSYAAAAATAVQCDLLNHVHVAWRNPATWSNVLDHRCGRLMLLGVGWSLLEMVLALVWPRERDAPFAVA